MAARVGEAAQAGERGLSSEYTWKVEPAGLSKRLDFRRYEKREIKDDSMFFSMSEWEDGGGMRRLGDRIINLLQSCSF